MTDLPQAAAPAAPDERYLVPGLARGLSILEAMGASRRELGLADLARAAGLTRSAAFRLVYTLSELGFLIRDEARKTYRLGPRVMQLGFAYLASQELVEVARPHLEALRDRTNCSAHLGMLEDTDIVYVARYPDSKQLTSRIQVGARLPAHATSMGRMILANMRPETVRQRYAGAKLKAFSAATRTTLPGLMEQLAEDRRRGCVISRSGFESGIASVAAPVFDAQGRVAGAINISTPEATVARESLETTLKEHVLATAAAISNWLGHRGRR
jgi:DNA-binding IclR family transcriptional regulator